MNRWMRRGCKGDPRSGNPRKRSSNTILASYREARYRARKAYREQHGVPEIKDAWVKREWTDKEWSDFRERKTAW